MQKQDTPQTTILVVDDDEHLRYTLQAYLQQLGYKVMCAENGERGLSVYRQHHQQIGLVLLDMVMPKMNGLELFYALQRQNPQVSCIMISGNEPSAGVKEALSAGMIAFLQKPMSLPVLASHLKAILSEEQTTTR
jgi:two-component system cell cycle sensor histidine kinase/response regulator CckA